MSGWLRLSAVAMAAAAVFLGAAPDARAQASPAPPPPQFPSVDPNGVDATTMKLTLSRVQASVGEPGGEGLARVFQGSGARDNLTGTIDRATFDAPLMVSVGGRSVKFNVLADGSFENLVSPDTLTFDAGTQKYTFIAADGTVAIFDRNLRGYGVVAASEGYLTTLTRPNGEVLTYHYTSWATSCSQGTPVLQCVRLQAVTSTLGYMIKYEYAGPKDDPGSTIVQKVTAVNLAHEYCDPLAESCTFTQTWPHKVMSGYMGGTATVYETDALGRQTAYTFVDDNLTQIQEPGGVTRTITYGGDGAVAQISDGVTTWGYAPLTGDPGVTAFAVYAGVNQWLWSYAVDPQHGRVVGEGKPGGSYQYEMMIPGPRLRRVIAAEGDYTEYGYDARGNVTSVRKYSKTGVLGHETTIAYPATCTPTTRTTCNRPLYVLEGSTNGSGGARTDFTYETHGAVKSITRPPGANGVRPKTSYAYQQKYAHYHQGAGLADAPTPVWRLTSVSTCITQAPCGGTPDETKANYAYGTAGTANNLRVSSITERAGDDSVLAKTSFTYNIYGDVRTIDGPLTGTVDVVRNRYNFEREMVGQVGPDPDGAGPRAPTATRYNLRPDGRIQSVDVGTVADQGDAAWANFNLIESETYGYDVAGRLITTTHTGGGATHSLVQVSYDAAGRLECTAVRMNPAAFGSPPASACTLGPSGADGPDRITKNQYNSLSQLARVTEAFGTGAQRDAVTTTYTNNAKVHTVADGKGNLTTYEYDGFDRPSRTRYPDPANVGTSSSSDYEELTYDPTTWDVVQHRRRNGQVESFTYDPRGNLLSNSLPGPTTYSYDNLDRLRTAATSGGETITDAYDALSRLTSSTIGGSTVGYEYNAAGQRTRLTWPDGFYVTYSLDNTGAVTAIRQSGSTSLVSFTYDALGRRQTLDRPSGISTTYSYDGASRLTSLAHGGSVSQTLTFAYNPASQIKSRTGSNADFNFTGLQALDHTYTNNGLNQVTAVGAQAISHDDKGNLLSDGASTYTHDADNRLTGVAGGATLAYDPIGRLRQITANGLPTRFIYDGVDLIAELDDNGGVLHRYVHGPGVDEPLVWFEGSDTGEAARRWLHADHQGSTIAATGSGGATRDRNTYDEYGVPGASNVGRFQYTGQVRIPELDLYYYKSRFYSARYGRFLEPDPIGYGDGLNLYGYVQNDPLNLRDPTGTEPNTPFGWDWETEPWDPGPADCSFYSQRAFMSACGGGVSVEVVSAFVQKNGELLQLATKGLGETPTPNSCPVSTSSSRTVAVGASDKIYQAGHTNTVPSQFGRHWLFVAHGSERGMANPAGGAFSTAQVAQQLSASGYQVGSGQPVLLGSCNVGLGTFPKRLANTIGACVTAPRGYVIYSRGKHTGLGTKASIRVTADREGRVPVQNQWTTVCPGG